ncbi:hypothetical protein [Halomarina rubra]|uniref:50S ribosomal protein L31 n=1 Tax=Halomarina rubra TaxID=2071873 RepID=A0ABD6B0M2_9EURY|nr:hypothetical protein [Halomarina rubra]
MSEDQPLDIGRRAVVTKPGHPRRGERCTVVDVTTYSHPVFERRSYVVEFDGAGERAVLTRAHLRALD